jgi:hypothetical protein
MCLCMRMYVPVCVGALELCFYLSGQLNSPWHSNCMFVVKWHGLSIAKQGPFKKTKHAQMMFSAHVAVLANMQAVVHS